MLFPETVSLPLKILRSLSFVHFFSLSASPFIYHDYVFEFSLQNVYTYETYESVCCHLIPTEERLQVFLCVYIQGSITFFWCIGAQFRITVTILCTHSFFLFFCTKARAGNDIVHGVIVKTVTKQSRFFSWDFLDKATVSCKIFKDELQYSNIYSRWINKHYNEKAFNWKDGYMDTHVIQ